MGLSCATIDDPFVMPASPPAGESVKLLTWACYDYKTEQEMFALDISRVRTEKMSQDIYLMCMIESIKLIAFKGELLYLVCAC